MTTLPTTPVEEHQLAGHTVYVKREDQCVPRPGPPFSKMRGLMKRLQTIRDDGLRVVGYTESAVSMAGWGIAWGCKQLGLKCVIFEPVYKEGNTPDLLLYHRSKWIENGAEIIPQKAGMVRVNQNIARNIMDDLYGRAGVLLPLGIPFPETVEETAGEAENEAITGSPVGPYKSVVVNVGSGTIAAGVAKGFQGQAVIYGIMGRTGDVERKAGVISKKARITIKKPGSFFGIDLRLVDPGWDYTARSYADCPFLCHPYYDLKAWQWLEEKIHYIKKPVLFWNIGSMPEEGEQNGKEEEERVDR